MKDSSKVSKDNGSRSRKGKQRPKIHPKVKEYHDVVQNLIDCTLHGMPTYRRKGNTSIVTSSWAERIPHIAKPEYVARALSIRTVHTREQLQELYKAREMPGWADEKTIDNLLSNIKDLRSENPADFYKQMCGVKPRTVPTFACVELAKAVMRKTQKYPKLDDVRRGLILEKICNKAIAQKIDYGSFRDERLYQAIATLYGRALTKRPDYNVGYLALVGMTMPEPISPTEPRYYGQLVIMNYTLGVVIDMIGENKYEVQFEARPSMNGKGKVGERVTFSVAEHNPYMVREGAVTDNSFSIPRAIGGRRPQQ